VSDHILTAGRSRVSAQPPHRRTTTGDRSLTVSVTLAADQLELLAEHVADLLRDSRDDGYLDIDAAARFLGGCSRNAVYHLVERGRIRARRFGGRLLFDPAELRQDVESRG
jgi:excisionase family DNA binding protein